MYSGCMGFYFADSYRNACFTTSNGNPVKPARAKEILENMAQSLGELIDSENGLLTNTLKSDKDR